MENFNRSAKKDPNLAARILAAIFPFLKHPMNISTSELSSLVSEDPKRAKQIAAQQEKLDLSERQAKKAKFS